MATFTAQIAEFIKDVEGATDTLIKQSLQDVINDAQKSRFKGGNLPIDTSFLINSGKAEIGVLPTGQEKAPEGFAFQSWDGGNVAATLARYKVGEVFYFGWTANYARAMENRYSFMKLAAQKWPQIVDKSTAKIKQRLGL